MSQERNQKMSMEIVELSGKALSNNHKEVGGVLMFVALQLVVSEDDSKFYEAMSHHCLKLALLRDQGLL